MIALNALISFLLPAKNLIALVMHIFSKTFFFFNSFSLNPLKHSCL